MNTPHPPSAELLALLQAVNQSLRDDAPYLVLADWLEEHDDPRKAELLRLHRRLVAGPGGPGHRSERAGWQARVDELLGQGVRLDPRCWRGGFHVTDHYVWVPQPCTPPVTVGFDVTCPSDQDEVLPCYSLTRAEWGSPDCDALSWYLSARLDAFTFRTQLFGSFPEVVWHRPAVKAVVGRKYRLVCDIAPAGASYSIDGRPYATATYVPATGSFGFAVYHPENIIVERISIDPLG